MMQIVRNMRMMRMSKLNFPAVGSRRKRRMRVRRNRRM
jgi:hypothetical protein